MKYLFAVEIFVRAPETGRPRCTSSDSPERRSRQSPSSRRRDPADIARRSELKENVSPRTTTRESPNRQRTSPKLRRQLPASKVFTVTGCPRAVPTFKVILSRYYSPSSSLYHLLPPPRDTSVLSRLRTATRFAVCTSCHTHQKILLLY